MEQRNATTNFTKNIRRIHGQIEARAQTFCYELRAAGAERGLSDDIVTNDFDSIPKGDHVKIFKTHRIWYSFDEYLAADW